MSGRGGPPASGADAHDEALTAAVHELRTPLTAIRALAELMQDSPDMDPAERDGFLSIIMAESARLGRLVDGILDAARLGTAFADWDMAALDPAGRTRTEPDLTEWLGKRASAGRMAPRGFPRDNRFT